MDWRFRNCLFTIAVLPIFGVGNQVLFSAEATGVTHDKIHPKISIMAQWLWTVYLLLTITETVLLMLGGMNLFDAVCHSFTTTATGDILLNKIVWHIGILLYRVCDSDFYGPVGNKLFIIFYVPERKILQSVQRR